jgi:hypothetical protein
VIFPSVLNYSNLTSSVISVPPPFNLWKRHLTVTDTTLSDKANMMVSDGFNNISGEGSYEFTNMKATSNAESLRLNLLYVMNRLRCLVPATTSRAGVSYL